MSAVAVRSQNDNELCGLLKHACLYRLYIIYKVYYYNIQNVYSFVLML